MNKAEFIEKHLTKNIGPISLGANLDARLDLDSVIQSETSSLQSELEALRAEVAAFKKTDFYAMSVMAKENQDIRCAVGHVEFKSVKQGGHLVFGVDHKIVSDLLSDSLSPRCKYTTIAYVINWEQFNTIKKAALTTEKEKEVRG